MHSHLDVELFTMIRFGDSHHGEHLGDSGWLTEKDIQGQRGSVLVFEVLKETH